MASLPLGGLRRAPRILPLDGLADGAPRRSPAAGARVTVLAPGRSDPRGRRPRHPAVLRRRRRRGTRAAHHAHHRAGRRLLAARASRPQDGPAGAAADRLDSDVVQRRPAGAPGNGPVAALRWRRRAMRRSVFGVTVVACSLALASPTETPAQQPQRGGVFRIAIPDPPALDPHQIVNFLPQTVVSLAYSHLLRFPAGHEQTSSTDFRV